MKALVTGGAGFIGHHLIKELLKRDIEIVCVDNFTLGKQENVDEFSNNEKYKFYNINIDDVENFCFSLRDEKIDIIYHLAANSDIQKGGKEPSIDFKNTFMTTFGVLELARRMNIKKIFFSSTSAVYGEKNEKLSENTGGLKPISYYGGAKYASEGFISSYTFMNDFSTVIFRFPNVIGPNLTHGVVYDFARKLKANNKELEILANMGKKYIIRRVCGNCLHWKDVGDQRDPCWKCSVKTGRREEYGYCNEHIYKKQIEEIRKKTYED